MTLRHCNVTIKSHELHVTTPGRWTTSGGLNAGYLAVVTIPSRAVPECLERPRHTELYASRSAEGGLPRSVATLPTCVGTMSSAAKPAVRKDKDVVGTASAVFTEAGLSRASAPRYRTRPAANDQGQCARPHEPRTSHKAAPSIRVARTTTRRYAVPRLSGKSAISPGPGVPATYARDGCKTEAPLLRETKPNHRAARHFAEELRLGI